MKTYLINANKFLFLLFWNNVFIHHQSIIKGDELIVTNQPTK